MRVKKIETKPSEDKVESKYVCGMCAKPMQSLDDETEYYQAKCDLCQENHFLHRKKTCAPMLWSNSSLSKGNNKQLPLPNIFNKQLSLGLYCHNCRVECFLCRGKAFHTQGKFLLRYFV